MSRRLVALFVAVSAALVTSTAFGSQLSADDGRATRPEHILTQPLADHALPFLLRWDPSAQGTRHARGVAAQARVLCYSHPRAHALTDAARSAIGVVIGAAIDLAISDYGPRVPPFRSLAGALTPPVEARRASAGFGPRERVRGMTNDRHSGASFVAPEGAPVSSVAAGVVAFAGEVPGLGGVVVVDHGDMYHSVYAGLASLAVSDGEPIAAREFLGEMGLGAAGWPGELYFEIRDRGVPVDPALWLR